MSQKSLKGHSTATKLYSHVRGSLGRIAKRRYTRDLFDDIVDCQESHSDNNVSDEEKLLTLFRCFNNFFNRKFDSERLFKAYSYAMTKDRSKIIMNWLRQKKADNIYVIGRFILHISSFLEDQAALQQNRIRECGHFLNLVFCETTDVLDENFILIFSFLSRKGYFRSIMGFILKNFKVNATDLKNRKVDESSKTNDLVALDTWIMFLVFPLTFAVKWRLKVEDWLKSEAERSELYGSNNSIDDDYANTSIMNMSLMSVSSEYSSEDPHSRQTRLFLKRLLSSWCNSVYFNDVFYQYFVTYLSVNLSSNVLVNTVPVYLIILALVEPTRQKRKHSIDSILSYNKTLSVLYKLNANPSLGLLNLLVSGICGFQQSQGWNNIGQEEAYGIIVCLHLTILALFDQSSTKEGSDDNNNLSRSLNHKLEDVYNLNENLKMVISDIRDGLSQNISHVIRIALSGLLDPNVVLPLAYLYQNLKDDLKASQQTISGCRMILSKNMPFLRYIWTLSQQAVTSRNSSVISSSSDRHLSDSNERSAIFKIIADGKFVLPNDMHKFLSILSTMMECVIFHLNTLYKVETRRKTTSSYGTSPAAVCSNFLLWPELWNMTRELAVLSIGLIKIVFSCVNLKETEISSIQSQSNIKMESLSYEEIVMKGIQNLLQLMRIFYIHIDKLNSDNSSIDEHIAEIDCEIVKKSFSKEQIQSIFDNTNFVFNLKDGLGKETSNRDGMIQLFQLKCLPQFCYKEIKLSLIKNFFGQYKAHYSNNCPNQKKKEDININCDRASSFKHIFHDILTNEKISIENMDSVILNGERIIMDDFLYKLLHEGLDPINNLFSCDGNQRLYPNPYVETFNKDYRSYYELLGKIFALNLLNGRKLQRRFSCFFLEKLLFIKERIYNINDLNLVDMEVAKNLLLLSKTDDELDCFNFKFVLTQNTFGKLHTYPIVTNGANIPVTNENKNEYIHGVVEFLLDKQIKIQCESFKKGIDSVFPVEIFTLLSTKDLHSFLSDH